MAPGPDADPATAHAADEAAAAAAAVDSLDPATLYTRSWKGFIARLKDDPGDVIRGSRDAYDKLKAEGKSGGSGSGMGESSSQQPVVAREVQLIEEATYNSNFTAGAATLFTFSGQLIRNGMASRPSSSPVVLLGIAMRSVLVGLGAQMAAYTYNFPDALRGVLAEQGSPVGTVWCDVLKEELGTCMASKECRSLLDRERFPRLAGTCFDACLESKMLAGAKAARDDPPVSPTARDEVQGGGGGSSSGLRGWWRWVRGIGGGGGGGGEEKGAK